MRPLLWVSKSYDKLASALQKKGHEISASSVKRLLPTLGYSRQSNRKADEGSKHPDRNAQFEHINAKAIAAQAARQPVRQIDRHGRAHRRRQAAREVHLGRGRSGPLRRGGSISVRTISRPDEGRRRHPPIW
jgi:hypothetical protein